MSGVLWITGLSGAGKTSLAEKIVPKFRKVYQKQRTKIYKTDKSSL